MAKKYILKERDTGQTLYPVTSDQCIITEDGSGIASNKKVQEHINAELNASEGQLEVLNKIKEILGDDEDIANILSSELANKQEKLSDSPDIIYTPETRQLSITEAAKRAVFNDLWNEACIGEGSNRNKQIGKYDPVGAPDKSKSYYLNGLWLTYEEAVTVYEAGRPEAIGSSTAVRILCYKRFKTNLPLSGMNDAYGDYSFYDCPNLEVINATSIILYRTIAVVPKLHTIINLKDTSTNGPNIINAAKLENLSIVKLTNSLNVGSCPLINLASWQQIVGSAAPTKAITITVHSDVFDKLIGDDESEAFTSLSSEEKTAWAKVLTDAQNKNITFATA